MAKTLITGATGFVGSAVARELFNNGREIRVLVRRDNYLSNLYGIDYEIAKGDINDLASLKQAMIGCDRVFHVAAVYLMWTKDPDSMVKTNIEGTRNVLKAAKEQNIERVVYTSSVAAIGIRNDNKPSNEIVDWNLGWINDPYVTSKYKAKQVVLEFIKEGMDVVILHPSAPIGVGDIKPTPTGQMICDFLNGKTPVYFKGGFDLVDVEDVAIGHRLADEKAKSGESYILGGTNIFLKDMYKMLSDISGIKAPAVFLPHGIDLFASWTLTKFADLITKKPPLITLGGCRMVKLPPFYDHSKASDELGYKPRPLRETMERAIEYFYKMGYARKGNIF